MKEVLAFEKECLRKACLIGHSWSEIMSILKKDGVKMSQSTAETTAWAEHYPRPHLTKGGSRDHSHCEKQLFRWRPRQEYERVRC
jgi:hypothetical protein